MEKGFQPIVAVVGVGLIGRWVEVVVVVVRSCLGLLELMPLMRYSDV